MTALMTSPSAATTVTGATDQYLTFRLHDEEYGLDILKVQEIRGVSRITPIPNVASHIRGVINLRGTVVPVIDLRIRFGISADGDEKSEVIIVVTIRGRVMGLIVSAVSDVVNFAAGEVQPPPEFGAGVDVSFITGMVKHNDSLVLVLDIDRLLEEESSAS